MCKNKQLEQEPCYEKKELLSRSLLKKGRDQNYVQCPRGDSSTTLIRSFSAPLCEFASGP